jgi:hypothetical protein
VAVAADTEVTGGTAPRNHCGGGGPVPTLRRDNRKGHCGHCQHGGHGRHCSLGHCAERPGRAERDESCNHGAPGDHAGHCGHGTVTALTPRDCGHGAGVVSCPASRALFDSGGQVCSNRPPSLLGPLTRISESPPAPHFDLT